MSTSIIVMAVQLSVLFAVRFTHSTLFLKILSLLNFLDKKFGNQANALVHLRAHTQEKTYKCNQCDSAFCDSSTLKKHMRIHTGIEDLSFFNRLVFFLNYVI